MNIGEAMFWAILTGLAGFICALLGITIGLSKHPWVLNNRFAYPAAFLLLMGGMAVTFHGSDLFNEARVARYLQTHHGSPSK